VAGFEVALDFVQARYMEPVGAVEETYLLDSSAKVLATSKGAAMELDVDDVEKLPLFENPVVTEWVRGGESGVFIEELAGFETVYVISRLPTLNWFYVARAPLAAVISTEK